MKKIISIVLAVMLVVSVASVSFGAVTYNPTDSYTVTADTPTAEEAFLENGGDIANSQVIYFQGPKGDDKWANQYNTLPGTSYPAVCAYWWAGAGSEWADGTTTTWVGYRAKMEDEENRIYSIRISNDGTTPLVIFNNGVNGGMDKTADIYNYSFQTEDTNTEGAYEGDYDTLPEGSPTQDDFDGCIMVVTGTKEVENAATGLVQTLYTTSWYVYYGNGCYGEYAMDSENFHGRTASCVNPEHEHATPGDVNRDKVVDVNDVLTLQLYLSDMLEEDAAFDSDAADVDGDGYISIIDATRIQRYLAKMCNIDGSKPYKEA